MLVENWDVKLKSKLSAQAISTRALLDKLRLIDESSRKSSQYQDPRYLPFYYYLSRLQDSKSLLHVGFDLGLPSCCFLQGCSSVNRMVCFQRKSSSFYSPRIAISNIKDIKGKNFDVLYHYGSLLDKEIEAVMSLGFDSILITERMNDDQMNEALNLCWEWLNLDGILCIDHSTSDKHMGEMIKDFCKAKDRQFSAFETRYGAVVVQK